VPPFKTATLIGLILPGWMSPSILWFLVAAAATLLASWLIAAAWRLGGRAYVANPV